MALCAPRDAARQPRRCNCWCMTLRYKRLDGVPRVLETVATAWFPQGRQAVDLRATLRALRVAVQVIWGRDDRIIPAAHAAATADGTRVSVLDGVGHLPHMERAGE